MVQVYKIYSNHTATILKVHFIFEEDMKRVRRKYKEGETLIQI
jgi:hypothetical protein